MIWNEGVRLANDIVVSMGFPLALRLLDILWLVAALLITALWFSGEPGAVPTGATGYTRMESRVRAIWALLALLLASGIIYALRDLYPPDRPLEVLNLQFQVAPQDRQAWIATYRDTATPPYRALLVGVLAGLLSSYGKRAAVIGVGQALLVGLLLVGTGLHWLLPVLGFIVFGAVFVRVTLLVEGFAVRQFTPLLLRIDNHAAITYPVLFLLLVDFANGFPTFVFLFNQVERVVSTL